VEGSCEHGNEILCSVNCWEILESHSDWQLLKGDSGPAHGINIQKSCEDED
jgi:hypothetical protein